VSKHLDKILIIIILTSIIVCDQVTKSIVRQKVDYGENITVISNFITLTKVENTGAFLSMGNSLPPILYKLLMIAVPLIVIGYATWVMFTDKNLSRSFIAGLCFIIGGGLGNILDRILYSSVTDFLHFDFVIFQTGIVNIADIAVTAGVFILLYELFIKRKRIVPGASGN